MRLDYCSQSDVCPICAGELILRNSELQEDEICWKCGGTGIFDEHETPEPELDKRLAKNIRKAEKYTRAEIRAGKYHPSRKMIIKKTKKIREGWDEETRKKRTFDDRAFRKPETLLFVSMLWSNGIPRIDTDRIDPLGEGDKPCLS